jgi:phosphoribosylpyrophosphate synthetase
MMVFTGNANPVLAQEVATHLGIELGRADVGRFSDGEIMLELLENVRGRDVFVLQSTSYPTNDSPQRFPTLAILARTDARALPVWRLRPKWWQTC